VILLLKLIIAHLIGDFFLQNKIGIEQKQAMKWRAPYLYIHVCIHFVLMLLIAGIEYWLIALIISISHLIIDGLKVQFQKPSSMQAWFFADQALHLVAIGIAYISFYPLPEISFGNESWLLLGAAILLTQPVSFGISMAMDHWSQLINEGNTATSLPKAGQYIGILERLLILGFVLTGHFSAIGFLMAAKSVFRFGDLTRAKDRRLTEYILIGTFLSFGIAILTSCLLVLFMEKV
jgi:hypothetical protein